MFKSEHMYFQNYGQIPNSDLHPVVKKKWYLYPSLQKKKNNKKKRERNLVIF